MWKLLKFFFLVFLLFIIVISIYAFAFDISPISKELIINVPIK